MALVIKGTKVREVTKETGPKGKLLAGDDLQNHDGHTSAMGAVKGRLAGVRKGAKTVGFAGDDPNTAAAFSSLHEATQAQRKAARDTDDESDGKALRFKAAQAKARARKPAGEATAPESDHVEPVAAEPEPVAPVEIPQLKPNVPVSKKPAKSDEGGN